MMTWNWLYINLSWLHFPTKGCFPSCYYFKVHIAAIKIGSWKIISFPTRSIWCTWFQPESGSETSLWRTKIGCGLRGNYVVINHTTCVYGWYKWIHLGDGIDTTLVCQVSSTTLLFLNMYKSMVKITSTCILFLNSGMHFNMYRCILRNISDPFGFGGFGRLRLRHGGPGSGGCRAILPHPWSLSIVVPIRRDCLQGRLPRLPLHRLLLHRLPLHRLPRCRLPRRFRRRSQECRLSLRRLPLRLQHLPLRHLRSCSLRRCCPSCRSGQGIDTQDIGHRHHFTSKDTRLLWNNKMLIFTVITHLIMISLSKNKPSVFDTKEIKIRQQ